MVSVRMVTATSAAPFSGVDWLMVTMLAPAALMPARRLCSAPVSSREQSLMTIRSHAARQVHAAGRSRDAARLPAGQKLLGADDFEKDFRQHLRVHQIKTAFQLVHLTNTSVLAENIIASDSPHCKGSDAILSDYPVLCREVPSQRTGIAIRCRKSMSFSLSRCRGWWYPAPT